MDYGCGRGDDIARLTEKGFDAVGWDPAHRPDGPKRPSEVVNLGYVLNVIEDPPERAETLSAAWSLTRDVLVVAALVTVDTNTKAIPFGDGLLTTRGTFQKYFDQKELELFIRDVLGVEPVALGLGVFAVARSEGRRARLQALRFRHRTRAMPPEAARALFEDNHSVLQPMVDFVSARGRFPKKSEAGTFGEIAERFGSVAKAARLLQRALPDDFWQSAVSAARDDILVFLALEKFGKRPRFSQLDADMQEDVRAHFGSYAKAVEEADELLFSLGQPGLRRSAAKGSAVGKTLPDGIYVHVDALDLLPIELRLFEGCARRYIGGAEGANLVKLRLDRPMISYLSYEEFWKNPHPALQRSLRVDLQDFRVRVDDYSKRANPPVLHRKELFISKEHPKWKLFSRLTSEEEEQGLLDSPSTIGTLEGWNAALAAKGFSLRGHKLHKEKPEG